MSRPRLPILALCAVALAGIAITAQVSAPTITILSRDGRRTLTLLTSNSQEYVPLDETATAFGATVADDRLAGGVTVSAGGRALVLTPNQTVVSVAGRLVSLPTAPIRQGNRWLVPVDFLPRALGPLLNVRLDLRRTSRLLVVGDLRVPRVTVRVQGDGRTAEVTFEATPVAEARVLPGSGTLDVVFEADALDLVVPPVGPQPLVQAIGQGATPTTVRIVTGPRFGTFRTVALPGDAGTSRISVELLATGVETAAPPASPTPGPTPIPPAVPAPGAPPAPPLTPTAPDGTPITPPAVAPPAFRAIVIDPGHGGDDAGSQGVKGSIEKDVTLAVARRLRTLVEGRLGLRVFMTREDDRMVGLDERTAFANSRKADLFLSLHANAAPAPALKGAEVYYLDAEGAEAEARRLAEQETVVLPALGGGSRPIALTLWETAQLGHLARSSTLATLMEQSLRARVDMSPRAIQQASLRVLVGANMPAVLVEVGYVSNLQQDAALRSGDYQNRLAESLLDAIGRFRDYVDRAASGGEGAVRP